MFTVSGPGILTRGILNVVDGISTLILFSTCTCILQKCADSTCIHVHVCIFVENSTLLAASEGLI